MPTLPSDTSISPDARYMLDAEHNIVLTTDWAEWCKWMAGPLCPRWMSMVPPPHVRVFTFFAGMPDEHGAFFWTTITNGRYHGRSGHALSYKEAKAQHARVVTWLRARLDGSAK